MAKRSKTIRSITHDATRKNIPTSEYQAVMRTEEHHPVQLAYERRNRDLDPQLVWRGKDEQDAEPLMAQAPPLYIQEKVHPKALIDSLVRYSKEEEPDDENIDLFADFNGLPDNDARTEFYQHDANWSNRMILGDSLHVMASLAEREDLRGKVQCIYFDPPYGIKFNSNFQWSTTSRDVKDGKRDHITREPEQVKAFRDTWRDGIHSYLSYLRDRLTVARDLLTDSGSIFVQIGDENVHRVRAVMDEVFGDGNHIASIVFRKTTGKAGASLDSTYDVLLWHSRNGRSFKARRLFFRRDVALDKNYRFDFRHSGRLVHGGDKPERIARMNPMTSQSASDTTLFSYKYRDKTFVPGRGGWKTTADGMRRLEHSGRLAFSGKTLCFVRPFDDYGYQAFSDVWDDTRQSGFGDAKHYVVQTATRVIQRCILMATDPGDLVFDPTCGSGTTAYVAEQWGRRWITIDTSRVALALARARIMGARYPYYLLADSQEGQRKEAVLTRRPPSDEPTYDRIRQGFVYERVPHVTLGQIANNAEIDVIRDSHQEELEPLRQGLNSALGESWEEWEIPREPNEDWSADSKRLHAAWWRARQGRQHEIDASIAANAPLEYLYDKPYKDRRVIRVAGPFTVESLSPHRMLAVGENDELLDRVAEPSDPDYGAPQDFAAMILENLRTAGVQQAHKEDRITFSAVNEWPGTYICAEGQYEKRNRPKRAGIMIGPEFGSVYRPDLVAAAREAAEIGCDALIACAFNYDAASSDVTKFGRIPVLKARMNADLHMATDLRKTDKGNLFVIFGEPDIEIRDEADDQIAVEIKGVDVFDPGKGEVRSDDVDGIACWFIDTDYDEESFFVRHAYFLGARDPYKSLKTSLKSEINAEAWASLKRARSRPFPKPQSGRIAVKVINHLGDEVMKVFRV